MKELTGQIALIQGIRVPYLLRSGRGTTLGAAGVLIEGECLG
jgi:hypothetical protein